jgi:hypothetical protein
MTQDIQTAKRLILDYTEARDGALSDNETLQVCKKYMIEDHSYRGMNPFYDLKGPEALASVVWSPIKDAMPTLQRRSDIFFAGRHNLLETAGCWVVEMGNFIGDFTDDWMKIPATGSATYLPYATLYRVEHNLILETVEFLDIFAVITQAGLNPFLPNQSGGFIMSPGPKTHNGLLTNGMERTTTAKTHVLTLDMLTELATSYTSPPDHIERFWNTDMNWFGPTGIGASLGFSGYRRGHTGPFEEHLDTVKIHDWELAVSEGHFSAVMWWPCLTMRNKGGFMGVRPNEALAEMRVVDLYRRGGDKLAENWIFIDILHFLKQQGVDLLKDIGKKS